MDGTQRVIENYTLSEVMTVQKIKEQLERLIDADHHAVNLYVDQFVVFMEGGDGNELTDNVPVPFESTLFVLVKNRTQ